MTAPRGANAVKIWREKGKRIPQAFPGIAQKTRVWSSR
jgi:hypothetical protein